MQETQGCRLDPKVSKIPWRRKWQPTPVFLPGEPIEQSLMGYSLWGHNSQTWLSTVTHTHTHTQCINRKPLNTNHDIHYSLWYSLLLPIVLGGSKITADGNCSHEIKGRLLLGKKVMKNVDSILKNRHYFANKGPLSQSYVFFSSHVWMLELDYKERWVLKNWCFWTVVLEKILESPLDSKEIQPVNPKGNQSWIFIGRKWCWSWNSNTLATWCEEPMHCKRPWCWERLKVGGKGDNRGWDSWMASPTQWTRV